MSDWITINALEGSEAAVMPVASGCLVRVTYTEDAATLAFVPDSYIVGNEVVARPARLQVSETQCITIDEVAAISKRPNELVFILRCGKEISVTEDIDNVLATFMQVAP